MLLLFYTSIPVERSFGSRKFAVSFRLSSRTPPQSPIDNSAPPQSFLVVNVVLATVLEFVALILGSRLGFHTIPAGPFATIFSILRVIPFSRS